MAGSGWQTHAHARSQAVTLFNQMRSCSGTFPEVGRLSSMCVGLLEEIRTQGEEAHLVAVGLMEPCIGELLHRILGNCEDHAAGISANQAALVAELSGEGRRHLLGLPNPDTDEPKYIEVMNEKSSGLASTQSRLAAAIAAVSTEGQPKISEAAAISGKLMHHVCLPLRAAHDDADAAARWAPAGQDRQRPLAHGEDGLARR